MRTLTIVVFNAAIIICISWLDMFTEYRLPYFFPYFIRSFNDILILGLLNSFVSLTILIPLLLWATNFYLRNKTDLKFSYSQGIVLFFVLQVMTFLTVW